MKKKSVEFYSGEVGEITENGTYTIINPNLLKNAAENDQYAKKLYNSYLNSQQIHLYNKKEFANCVFKNQFAWLIDAFNGDTWKALGEALSYKSKAAGASVNIAFTTASLSLSAYNCRSL